MTLHQRSNLEKPDVSRSRRRLHCGDDRGAALVEFALIAPFLFLILFGIIEFGLTLNDYQSVRQGVREGARDAVVGDYGGNGSCGLVGATGSGTGMANSREVMCKVKERAAVGSNVRVAIRVVAADGTTTTPLSGTADNYATYKVRVCAAKPAGSLTGLLAPFLNNVMLRSEIEMRVEKKAVSLATLEETAPNGSNWSWC